MLAEYATALKLLVNALGLKDFTLAVQVNFDNVHVVTWAKRLLLCWGYAGAVVSIG